MDPTMPPPNSKVQPKNVQLQVSSVTQQVGAFSQANSFAQNRYLYPVKVQIRKNQPKVITTNKQPIQNTGNLNNFPNMSTPNKGTGSSLNIITIPQNSFSSIYVRVAPPVTQNSSLKNVHTSSVVLQGNTGQPTQNVPKNTLNTLMTLDKCNNQPPPNYHDFVRTSSYHQSSKPHSSRTSSRRVSANYANGPGASQVGTTSSHHLNSQQSLSRVSFSVGQNVQNQTSGSNSAMTGPLQSQQYASYSNQTQYGLSSDCYNRNATQVFSQTTNGNPSLSYPPPPVQINHGQFVQPQPHTNFQVYPNTVLDQNSNAYSIQHAQKYQSAGSVKEINVTYSTNGHNTHSQFSNESTRSLIGENPLNAVQVPGIVNLNEALAPPLSRTLDQDKNTSNNNGHFSQNLSKENGKITEESLALDLQNLRKLRACFIEEAEKVELKMHLAIKQNEQTSGCSVDNQNPNVSLPCNVNENLLLPPLHESSQGFPVPTWDTTHNKSFSSVSSNSSQIKDGSLLRKKTQKYLVPILEGLLKGTVDENILSLFETEDKQDKRLLATEDNSSNTSLVSSEDVSGNNKNNIDSFKRPTFTTSSTSPAQEAFKKNVQNFGLSSVFAKNQLEKIPAVTEESKDTAESCGLKSNLESSGQNANASGAFSLSMKNGLQEYNADAHCSSLFQQGEKPEEKIGSKSENTSAASSSSLATNVRIVPETGSVQKPSGTNNTRRIKGICSLEELEASLALWRKNLSTSLRGHLSGRTESPGSSSSIDDGADGKKTQQMLENLPSVQNDQTEITNETVQQFVLATQGKNLDALSTNSLKSCEPQVAIVTPLILSKDNIKNEMPKNSPNTEIMYTASEEGGMKDLQDISPVLPHTDEWKGASSPSSSDQYYKDLDMTRKAVTLTEQNGVVKAEAKTSSTCDLNQGVDNCSLQLKHHESQLITNDSLQSEMYTGDLSKFLQNDVQHQIGSDVLRPKDTVENMETDTMLQISSVCTLVQGNACYNSQIASIFNNGLLKYSAQNDTSEEFLASLPCDDLWPDFLKNELGINIDNPTENVLLPSPNSLSMSVAEMFQNLPALDTAQSCKATDENSEVKTEEIKDYVLPESMPSLGKMLEQNMSHSSVHCGEMTSDNQLLTENEESASISNGMHIIEKDSIVQHVSVGEKEVHSGSIIEAPLSLLSDQLAELSKEFPYGISNLKAINVSEGNDSMTEIVEKKDKDNTKTSGESLCARDTEDQINIMILNSQQMKEVLPKPNHHSSNKSEKHDQPKMNSEKNLNVGSIKTEEWSDIDSEKASTGTTVENKQDKYCCVLKFLSRNFVVQPCSCRPASNEKAELASPTDTVFQSTVKVEDNCTIESRMNSELPTVTCKTISESVPSGVQHKETLHKDVISREVKEPSKEDKATSPLVLLDKLDSQTLKNSNEQVMAEFSTHVTSLLLKTEMEEINEKHDISSRECLSAEQAQSYSATEKLKMAPGRNLYKMDSGNQRRRVVIKSKTDARRRRRIEIKSSCGQYRIKRDSNETHIIKGPTSKKRKQKAVEKRWRSLAVQSSGYINPLKLSSIESASERCENEKNSMLHSQEHSNGKKLRNIKDLEKRYGYRKGEHNEATFSERRNEESEHSKREPEHSKPEPEHSKPESEHSKPESEHSKPESEPPKRSIKIINLQKYAYSEERENAWKYRSLHADNRTPVCQKQRGHTPNVCKKLGSGKEDVLDTHSRDTWSERSFADKKSFRRSGSFQREIKKNYLNRLAFKRTAQKTIRLTTLDSSYSKSSSLSGSHRDHKSNVLLSQNPEEDNQQMLEFKMCPEILFRNPVSEEQRSDGKKLAEETRTPIKAIKSKREDWLNYVPVKRRKTEGNETPADDGIPLDTAIKFINGDEVLPLPVKDSNATFLTYQKIHLGKKSQSLDASPLN